MDDPRLPEDEHRVALAALRRVNRVSRVVAQLLPMVLDAADRAGGAASVLDVACGSADVLIGLGRAAAARGRVLTLKGVDVSQTALRVARERADGAGVRVELESRDVLGTGLGGEDARFDVVMCSLFLHHLREDDIVSVLTEMKRVARREVLVSDLRRCTLGLVAAHLAGTLCTRSRIVRVDAVRSVQGSLTMDELGGLAERAGLDPVRIRRCWPFRMMLHWRRF